MLFVVRTADQTATFSAQALYGCNLREFSESDDDFSAEEDYVLPSEGHQMSLDDSMSEDTDCDDPGADGSCGDRQQRGAGG